MKTHLFKYDLKSNTMYCIDSKFTLVYKGLIYVGNKYIKNPVFLTKNDAIRYAIGKKPLNGYCYLYERRKH